MQELGALRHLVVDLEHGRHGEQCEKPEVDHRVHQSGRGVAQQGAHVNAGTEVGQASLDVLGRGRPALGCATFPVANAIGEHDGAPHQHHRDHGVERDLQRAGNATEHFAAKATSRRANR